MFTNLSQIWFNIQYTLFPFLEKEYGNLPKEYKTLVAILEIIQIEKSLPSSLFLAGRPAKDRYKIARAFVAKIVLQIPTTNSLILRLKTDPQLRIICGWDKSSKIPDKTVFSRSFTYFAKISLPSRVHETLIAKAYKDKTVIHLTKDSTPIIAREKIKQRKTSRKERKKQKDRQMQKERKEGTSRKQKQLSQTLDEMIKELPANCDISAKKGPDGYKLFWKGYKLHSCVDDNGIPISVLVTSASLNDSEVAIPLAEMSNRYVTSFYDLMDSAYDTKEIKQHSISLGHIPIIDSHSRSKKQKEDKLCELKRRKILNIYPAEQKRYRERFSKERFNATFKDFYSGRNLFYRGHAKVSCHIMFGVLALTANAIIKLIQ